MFMMRKPSYVEVSILTIAIMVEMKERKVMKKREATKLKKYL